MAHTPTQWHKNCPNERLIRTSKSTGQLNNCKITLHGRTITQHICRKTQKVYPLQSCTSNHNNHLLSRVVPINRLEYAGPTVHTEFAGQVVCVAVVHTVVYTVTLLAHTVTVWTIFVGPDTLYAATVPGLPVVPVTELNKLQLVPSVEAATQAVYWSQTAIHDWIV